MAFQRTPLTDDNVFYHSQLGLARALELYIEAAGLDGRHKDHYNNLGVMLTGSGRQAAKLAAYQRAHAMPPDDAGIMSNLGNALREEGRMDEAKSLYDRAVAQTPANSEVIYNARLLYRDHGQPEKALALFEKTFSMRPDASPPRSELDLLAKNQGHIASGVLQQLLARNTGLGAELQTLHQVDERAASHLGRGCAT